MVRPGSRGLKCPRLLRESQALIHPSPAPAPSPWSFRPTRFAFLGLASSASPAGTHLGGKGLEIPPALEFQAWDRQGDKLGPLVPLRPLLVF